MIMMRYISVDLLIEILWFIYLGNRMLNVLSYLNL